MVADIVDRKDRLTVEVETIKPMDNVRGRELEQKIYERLLVERHEFANFMKTGSIHPPVIKVVAPDSLPRNPRTGKLKQVIDNRHA